MSNGKRIWKEQKLTPGSIKLMAKRHRRSQWLDRKKKKRTKPKKD